MKKCIAGLMTLLLLLTACGAPAGNGGAGAAGKEAVPVDIAALYTQLEAAGVPEMLELDAKMQLDVYGIRAEDVKQAKVTVASDGLRADEIWLIETLDSEKAANIKELAEGRIRQKDRESITYSPEQNAIVKKSYTEVAGNYVFFICSPEVEAMKNAVQTALGK